jgi:hypothetical protein
VTQKISPVICDGCGGDITTTGNSVDYRLALVTQSPIPWYVAEGQNSGAVTDMMIWPAIKETHHFCNNLDCLRAWLAGEEAVTKRRMGREEREERLSARYKKS